MPCCPRTGVGVARASISNIFISYARSTARQAQQFAAAQRSWGYSVWIDDDLPARRTHSRVIEEEMTAAKAAVVIWSADAVKSQRVLSEANRAREHLRLHGQVVPSPSFAVSITTVTIQA